MSQDLVATAVSLVTQAEHEQVPLRVLGSIATSIYTGTVSRALKDIDLIGRRRDRVKVQEFLKRRGWTLDTRLLLVSELRELYRHTNSRTTLDVYYDQIDGSHSIQIGVDRLLLSFPAITQTDLLLSKLQRHTLRAVDVEDCCALVSIPNFHLDADRLCTEVSKRWGLWQDVTVNLEELQARCTVIDTRIKYIQELIFDCRKSFNWRLRALIGKRSKWWTEVYDMETKATT